MSDTEEGYTLLLEALSQARLLAGETGLLHPQDVEALEKLAQLNQAQQQVANLPPGSSEHQRAGTQVSVLFHWLHILHNYPIHRHKKTGLWVLGTYIGNKD